MSINYYSGDVVTFLSTDSKPVVPDGYRGFELDTGKIFYRQGGSWNEVAYAGGSSGDPKVEEGGIVYAILTTIGTGSAKRGVLRLRDDNDEIGVELNADGNVSYILKSNVGLKNKNPQYNLDVTYDINARGVVRQKGVPVMGMTEVERAAQSNLYARVSRLQHEQNLTTLAYPGGFYDAYIDDTKLSSITDASLKSVKDGDAEGILELEHENGTKASRTADDSSNSQTDKRGLKINPNNSLQGIKCKISANTSGFSTAYLTETDGTQLASNDISNLSAGDTFQLEASLSSGTGYYVVLDNGGNSYTVGSKSVTYNFTSTDVDITAGVTGGTTEGSSNAYNIVDVTALLSGYIPQGECVSITKDMADDNMSAVNKLVLTQDIASLVSPTMIEDFENGVGSLTGDTGDVSVDDTKSADGDQSAKLDSSNEDNTVTLDFTDFSDTLQQWIYVGSDTGNASDGVQVHLNDPSGIELGQIRFEDSNLNIYWWDGSSETKLDDFVADKWYKVVVDPDFSNDTVDVYLFWDDTGKKVGSGLSMSAQEANIDNFEDGVDPNWTGDTGSLTAVSSPSLSGSQSGKINSTDESISVKSPDISPKAEDVHFIIELDNKTGNEFEGMLFEALRTTSEHNFEVAVMRLEFMHDGDLRWDDNEIKANYWSADTTYDVRIEVDYANSEADLYINDSLVSSNLSIMDGASDIDQFNFRNQTTESNSTVNAYIDALHIGSSSPFDPSQFGSLDFRNITNNSGASRSAWIDAIAKGDETDIKYVVQDDQGNSKTLTQSDVGNEVDVPHTNTVVQTKVLLYSNNGNQTPTSKIHMEHYNE